MDMIYDLIFIPRDQDDNVSFVPPSVPVLSGTTRHGKRQTATARHDTTRHAKVLVSFYLQVKLQYN
jgi:hypothetical protein